MCPLLRIFSCFFYSAGLLLSIHFAMGQDLVFAQSVLGSAPPVFSQPKLQSARHQSKNDNATQTQLGNCLTQWHARKAAAQSNDAFEAAKSLWSTQKPCLQELLSRGEAVLIPSDIEGIAQVFVSEHTDDPFFPWAFFYFNQARLAQQQPPEESFFFDQTTLQSLPAWAVSRHLKSMAQYHLRNGNYPQAAQLLLEEMSAAYTLKTVTTHEVEAVLYNMDSVKTLESFLSELPNDHWLQKQTELLKAGILLRSGHIDEASQRITELEGTTSFSDISALNALRHELSERIQNQNNRIGVLLPLNSNNNVLRQLAADVVDGVRLAIQPPEDSTKDSNSKGMLKSTGLQMVIRNVGSSPKEIAAATRQLIQEENVSAIIGPISRKASQQAAKVAEAYRTPLISFSIGLKIPKGYRYVFRFNKSYRAETVQLAKYAVDYLNIKRFAILYPDTAYGKNMRDLFAKAVADQQGEIVAAASYNLRAARDKKSPQLSLKQIFGRFTATDRPLNNSEINLLNQVNDTNPDPIVQFDGLFIPVGPGGSEDLPIITPYPVVVNAEHVRLLGDRFWNTKGVVLANDGGLNGAVFVDMLDEEALKIEQQPFLGLYRTRFAGRNNYRPPSRYTYLGFLMTRQIQSLLHSPKNRSRESLTQALRLPPLRNNIQYNWIRFTETGSAMTPALFFSIRGKSRLRLTP